MPFTLLFASLVACAGGTGAQSDAPPDLDRGWDTYGCGWAYIVGREQGTAFVLTLDLPVSDLYNEEDVSYARGLTADESFFVVDPSGAGSDTLTVFDCIDFSEDYSGQLWSATAATVSLSAVFESEEEPIGCTGGDHPNVTYNATVELSDIVLETGVVGGQDAGGLGPFDVEIGWCSDGG